MRGKVVGLPPTKVDKLYDRESYPDYVAIEDRPYETGEYTPRGKYYKNQSWKVKGRGNGKK